MDREINLLEFLPYIDPTQLDYQSWVNVGMALKEEGYSVSDWEDWSARDSARFHAGECERKWNSFNGSTKPVTGGTIVQMAKDFGWQPHRRNEDDEGNGYALDWDDEITVKDDYTIIDKRWLEGKDVVEPDNWEPIAQLIKYLETLFEASENVGFVTESWEKDGKYLPSKGRYDRTAGQLIEQLSKCNGDMGAVLGDYKPEAGAWIRFNPLDGRGVKNENVTEFRYALVESDTMEIDKQNAILRELELPIACLVHSGKKSLHAIVKVEAANYDEYRKRVDYLYNVCAKNGLKIDVQNRNPSRLSRMPGIMRNGRKQFLIDTNIGKSSWAEWHEWIEGVNDDLPEPENLAVFWDNMPDLAPPLIDGVLRQGHKMLIAGPSKAGKSFALIEMCIAIAEGAKWFGWNCTQGKIMYVNLELDRASCLHRFKDVYGAMGLKPQNFTNIDIWNLRGKSVPMDKLAPKLIRRAAKKNYIAIIIDPIYKVITGDENSADQMAHFCNQFDKVCCELGAAVIYCHHHSKGTQGGKKSMDRASGSGVFARDPDALLDLIELEVTENLLKQQENKAVCAECKKWLEKRFKVEYEEHISLDDECSEKAMLEACREHFSGEEYKEALMQSVSAVRASVKLKSAWRVEGTLREFPKFSPVNLWFDYPVHRLDYVGSLKDLDAEGAAPPWQKAIKSRKPKEEKQKERTESIETAYEACASFGDKVTVPDLEKYLGVTKNTVKNRLKEHGGFEIDNGLVVKAGVKKHEIDTDN